MSIGAGIAIAGVWVFCGMCALAPQVSGGGMLVAMFVAVFVTIGLSGQ